MKKAIVLVLLVFGVHSVFAQFAIGVKGGANVSKVSKFELIENITPEFRNLLGGQGAVFMEVPISSNLSFQPELQFGTKGFRIAEGIPTGIEFAGVDIPVNTDVDFRTSYIEIPLLLKGHIGNKAEAHAYIMGGPSLGYLADARARIRVFSFIPVKTNVNEDFFQPLDLNLHLVLGYEVPFNEKVTAFAEARYQQGITRIIDSEVFQFDVRNQTFAGNAGLKFNL